MWFAPQRVGCSKYALKIDSLFAYLSEQIIPLPFIHMYESEFREAGLIHPQNPQQRG